MEEDLFHVGCQTFEEMYSYCRKVASSVGLCLIEIYGYDDVMHVNMLKIWEYFCRW